jgi:2-hydroxy-3-oxopropionate reductase
MTVGFVGLGVMGAPMAANVAAEFDLVMYDVVRERVSIVQELITAAKKNSGISDRKAPSSAAASIEDVAASSEVILLSLPGSQIVRRVITDHLAAKLNPGTVVIDTSTTEPAVSQEVGRLLSKRDVGFLDAPVSGGEKGAREGTLSVMVGGDAATVDRCRPVLETIGRSIVHVGDVGMGEVAKLVNNLIVGVTFAAVAEGFSLGVKSGIDAESLYEAIRGGWAGSTVLEVAAPAMLAGDFTPGGTIDIHWKDLGYALSQAKEEDVPTPMTAIAHEVFKAARAAGRGKLSQPAIVKLWEDLLNIDISR